MVTNGEMPNRPYAPPSNVVTVLQRLRSINLPDRIDTDYLRDIKLCLCIKMRILDMDYKSFVARRSSLVFRRCARRFVPLCYFTILFRHFYGIHRWRSPTYRGDKKNHRNTY